MLKFFEKLAAFFLLIVFLTFLINHGHIDFSGVDLVVTKANDAINSEKGQEITNELKEISCSVLDQLTKEVKDLIIKAKEDKTRTEVSLLRVVDGDTLIVKIDEETVKVRLIGIDTPESVHADESKNNDYGEMASEHTKELLENITSVYLEFDDELEDVYGRLLAYVWLSPDTNTTTESIGKYMLNGIILKDGYAIDKVYEPNNRYATSFSLIRKEAEKNKTGLWGKEGFSALWKD